MKNPLRYFNSSPEIIRLTMMMYIRYPLSLRQKEDLLFELKPIWSDKARQGPIKDKLWGSVAEGGGFEPPIRIISV